jgi:hypothetical protein
MAIRLWERCTSKTAGSGEKGLSTTKMAFLRRLMLTFELLNNNID